MKSCGKTIKGGCANENQGTGGRAEYAAAALAYYRYTLAVLTDGNASEVKIGDITVKSVGMDAVDAAEKLCRDAFDRLQDCLEDNSFVFKGV